jgi:5-(aminomethyl)-3-furanmethanol phosphate kinase
MKALSKIVKVGGSLYELPDLGARLTRWLHSNGGDRIILVPGGGNAGDWVRELDRNHRLGEEAAHWLALGMLQVNAHFLARLLPGARVVSSPFAATPLGILDAIAFAREDEADPERLPHCWEATSDSLAIRVASITKAQEVVLLKSVAWSGDDWAAAARAGVVDAHFPRIMQHHPQLHVRVVNLRTWPACGGPA